MEDKKKKKEHVLSVAARAQYFAIFLRLGLFTRSYRWNAFKDNKEIKITRKSLPGSGGKLWNKQSNFRQFHTSIPFFFCVAECFGFGLSLTSEMSTLRSSDAYIMISFSPSLGQLWKRKNHTNRRESKATGDLGEYPSLCFDNSFARNQMKVEITK